MTRIRYQKYIPDPADEIDLEELMGKLRDFFLESGFQARGGQPGAAQDLEGLLRALAQVLSDHPQLSEETRNELEQFGQGTLEEELSESSRQLLEKLLRRLIEEGYLRPHPESGPGGMEGEGEIGNAARSVQFELTTKGVDFLGYRVLRDLLGSMGRGGFGRHRTDQLATGVATEAGSRPYEFGDSLNLDINATLLRTLRRGGLIFPLELEYEDLEVFQTERHSSCATVLMLDCSHSMILYGEDRFTPAKQVALALAHLIRTQYPGDTLELILFHDSAQRVDLAQLPAVKVGPYHTNTREGLRLAQRLLRQQRKPMKQIIMITDGKPSAITMPNGQIYKNPFGLDPMILQETFNEVAACRRQGIVINTFMVAQDHYLVEFVKQVSQICRGKAYFASTLNLARYLLMDFMSGKTRTVH